MKLASLGCDKQAR